MDPMNSEDSRSSSPTEDCGPPQKRPRLKSADVLLQSHADNSCSEINQDVSDQKEKEKNILEDQTVGDEQSTKDLRLSLEESRKPLKLSEAESSVADEINEIKLKNMELSTGNAQLTELMAHQAAEHESEKIAAEKKIIELQDKLKSISLAPEDIDFIRIQLRTAKALIERLASQNASLLEQKKELLSKAARAGTRALEEKLISPRVTAPLEEETGTQGEFCENAENLQQQVVALKAECDGLTSKVLKYMKAAASKKDDHDCIQDSNSDKITPGANENDETLSGARVEDDPDGISERVDEMEQGEQNDLLIQNSNSDKFTAVAYNEDDVEGVAEMKQGEQNRHHVIQEPNSHKLIPDADAGDGSPPGESGENDGDVTVKLDVAEIDQKSQDLHHFIQDPSSDKLIPDTDDEDESSSEASVEDDLDGTVENAREMEQSEQNGNNLIQDSSSNILAPGANDEDESSPGESVEDDLDGTAQRVDGMEQEEQNRHDLVQNSSSDQLVPDADDEDESSSGDSDESGDETKRGVQKFRITVGKHDYLVSNPKFSEIDWNKEYKHVGRQYVCRKCQKQSANVHYIQDHIWCHHYGERYECPYCEEPSQSYAIRMTLQKHMHRNHPKACRCTK